MPEQFIAYWGGYFNSDMTLDKTPDCVDTVILAFGGPDKGKLTVEFLLSKYSEEQVRLWIKGCQERGIKVLLSVIDNPDNHWNQIDIDSFCKDTYEKVIVGWGLDGIDIDAESAMPDSVYAQCFITLATSMRKYLTDERILTYTCYTGTAGPDGEILTKIRNHLDFINLMAYFDDFNEMEELFKDYAIVMPPLLIAVGVKAGDKQVDPSSTDIEEVSKLTCWNPVNTAKYGIMLWTINRDIKQFTGQKDLLWTNTIKQYLELSNLAPNSY